MRTITKRGAKLVAVLGTAVAVSASVAGPASAAAGDTHGTGLRCVGLVACGPFAVSNYPGGPFTNSVLNATVGTLLTTGVINTTANAGGATASVADLNANLATATTLAATAVSSQCTVDATTGAVSGSSSIVGGVITINGAPFATLDTAPAPNTALTVPGVASLILNRQVTDPVTGQLTVDAIYISLLPTTPGAEVIRVATSSCTPAPVVGTPVIAPAFAAGAGVLGLLVFGMYVVRRRRAVAPIAA